MLIALAAGSRRTVLAALLPLLSAPPACWADRGRMFVPVLGDLQAGIGGPGGLQLDRASAQLAKLAESLSYLQQLGEDLQNPTYKGDADDSMVVLRLSAIYWKSTPAAMEITSSLMPLLGEAEQSRLASLTTAFEVAVKDIEAACTQNDVKSQLAAASRANDALSSYLALAATRYSVPTIKQKFAVPAGSGLVS
jgi:hypothetical protein